MTVHPVGGAAGLAVAGFRFKFKSDSPGIISMLSRYGRFGVRGRAGYNFSVCEFPGGASPFKPAVTAAGSELAVKRGDFSARLDLATGAGELAASPREQCLDAFLRSLIGALLLRSGGLMLHSAGLVRNGKAYLFLGRSGAGKSTLSRLAAAAGCEVLSDEINLLRPEKGRFRAYGSPFWGEMCANGRPGSWPLGGVFLLEKARNNSVSGCAGPPALNTLLRCLLNFEKGPGVSRLVLDNAAGLLAKIPFKRLAFSKRDSKFLELI